jgi:hypothetical protein
MVWYGVPQSGREEMALRALSNAEMGERVRIVRSLADHSAKSVSEAMGKEHHFIHRIERAWPRQPYAYETLLEVARMLTTEGEEYVLDYFLGRIALPELASMIETGQVKLCKGQLPDRSVQ